MKSSKESSGKKMNNSVLDRESKVISTNEILEGFIRKSIRQDSFGWSNRTKKAIFEWKYTKWNVYQRVEAKSGWVKSKMAGVKRKSSWLPNKRLIG